MDSYDQSNMNNKLIAIKLEIEFLKYWYYHKYGRKYGVNEVEMAGQSLPTALCWGSFWSTSAWDGKKSVWPTRVEGKEVRCRHQPLLRINTCVRDKEEGKVTGGVADSLSQLDSN